jgi:hypothetical protein
LNIVGINESFLKMYSLSTFIRQEFL